MLDNIIKRRRSVRRYTENRISDTDIEKIIESGMWAPTACNKQDYRFIYLNSKKEVEEIYKMGSAHFLDKCNQAILVLYYNQIDNTEYHDDVLSAGMVIQNMLLKATEMNVGTCVIANLPSKSRIRKHFNIPSYYDPIALISLGEIVKEPKIMTRKFTVEEVLDINIFDNEKNQKTQSPKLKLWVRKILRKIYIRLPKTKLLKKMVDKFEKKFEN